MNTRPAPYQPPDREKWENTHKLSPYPIDNVPASFVRRAQTQLDMDWSTIDTEAVHRHQANLDAICEEVETNFLPLDANCDIHFDPTQGRFWAYPRFPLPKEIKGEFID